jgi:hypothetical protein
MNIRKWSSVLFISLSLLITGLIAACTSATPGNKAFAPLAQVCQGQGVEQAAAYTGGPPHKIVLMDDNGTTHPWMKHIPRDWSPSSIADTQLVLSIQEETEGLIELCKYETGPDIKRYRYSIDTELREAKTGNIVSHTTVYGEPPRQCEFVENMELARLEGTPVSFDNFQQWLALYVMDTEKAMTPEPGVTSSLIVIVHDIVPIKSITDINKSHLAFCSSEPEQCSSGLVRDIGFSMLAPYGLEYHSMLVSADDVLRGMETGIIDCAFIWAKHPWQPIQDSKYEYRFLSFDADARALAAGCGDSIVPAVVPAHTYKNQSQDVLTAGMSK